MNVYSYMHMHVCIRVFDRHEDSLAKSDVIFCCMQTSFFLRLVRKLHLRWNLERLELRIGESGVDFLASVT